MRDSFYGWYLKCQSDTQTLAVIPAVHKAGRKRTCSIQIITNDGAWTVTLSGKSYRRTGKNIFIGKNRFGENGIYLDIDTQNITAKGRLYFGALTPLKYDIMGPFSLVPFMECRHSVLSMKHWVLGKMCINGQEYSFYNGRGYWEGDEGRSFPKKYAWTQCNFKDGSLMLSVADIPIAGLNFTGVIGVILWRGRQYRFATYLGARVVKKRNGIIRIVQGNMSLDVYLIKSDKKALMAPSNGDMVRTIHESVVCTAAYRFKKGNRTIFNFKTDSASFEYEY